MKWCGCTSGYNQTQQRTLYQGQLTGLQRPTSFLSPRTSKAIMRPSVQASSTTRRVLIFSTTRQRLDYVPSEPLTVISSVCDRTLVSPENHAEGRHASHDPSSQAHCPATLLLPAPEDRPCLHRHRHHAVRCQSILDRSVERSEAILQGRTKYPAIIQQVQNDTCNQR